MADIDFGNAESRMNYLKENLGHLMKGIDKNYGQVLMDELMHRLEQTVSDFNEEVKAMLGQLQGIKVTPRDNILNSGPRGYTPRPTPSFTERPEKVQAFDATPAKEIEIEGEDGLSEFEKRLQALDN